MKLYEIIVQSANSALPLLDPETGSMPSGHNGPYYDPETPVRNTSHWLITFLKAYSISKEQKFKNAAYKTVKYLCSEEVRPMKAAFWHRKNQKKDLCNGLIGQAWTIEALVIAAIELEMPELIALAEEVFLLHPFHEDNVLWERVSVDGTYLGYDVTFNHQLWFAAAGSLLAHHTKGEVESQVCYFMEHLDKHLEVHPSGLIKHLISMKLFIKRKIFNLRIKLSREKLKRLTNLMQMSEIAKHRKYMTQKEIGYHSFNLYAFALIKKQYPNNSFWNNNKIKKALTYAQSEEYWNRIKDSKYSYPYNPPGFETAFALDVFYPDQISQQEKWLTEQFSRSYNFEQNMMNIGTEDTATYAARIYEATRLSNLKVNLS